MAHQNKYDKKHLNNLSAYEQQVDRLYRQVIAKVVAIGIEMPDLKPDKLFSFDDYPVIRERVEKLLSAMQSGLSAIILNGIESEWTLANNKNNELSRQVFGDNIWKLTQEQYKRYFSTNDNARKAFTQRKVSGLNLSDKVWRYTDQFKTEIELGLDVGIRSGTSADDMTRELRDYLRNTDKLFRRVRDEHGVLQLSKRAAAFHPGQGVYRSSYKNARRLAATETNIAYRTADYERWQQLDFVVGIEIKLSNNHPVHDICDELKGRYPKDFKFTGWHPHCRCHAITILKTDEEIAEDTQRILDGKPLNGNSANRVDDVPEVFKNWMNDNSDRISGHSSAPYFMTDNPQYTGVRPRAGGVGAVTGTKLGRAATKAAIKEYEDMKPTILTEEQRTNTAIIAKEMGLKGNKPMTFLEANEGRANINFGKGQAFGENCQCCVAVHEARLRGLNLTAGAYSGEKESVQYQLGEKFQDIWVNGKTGKTPQVSILKAGTDEALYGKLDKAISSTGRYHVGVNYGNGQGHVITAERLSSGKVVFYDAQSGEFLNIKEYTALESFEILKVDKLLFRTDWLRKISQAI